MGDIAYDRHLVIYEPNGFIREAIYGPVSDECRAAQEAVGKKYILVEGETPPDDIHDAWYVDQNTLLLRRREYMPILVTKLEIQADGHDFATITGIPPQAVVTVDGERCELANPGDPLEIAADMPATYRIKVTCWPFHDWEAEIRAL